MSYGITEFKSFSGARHDWMKYVLHTGSGLICRILGFRLEAHRATYADYSEWLGPDWKAEWDRPVTLVGNHVSFLDILFSVNMWCPVFVASHRARNIPGIGAVTDAMNAIYVERLSGDPKESRRQAL
mmetsp:Transcript_27362/g.41615  ORF Transcript_27362/g.41615 Transcript_27362/m.41615 type:complete len:127 (-) Transcript_27362:517-897(-)|eukprot:CAMPEP_0170492994 /NCGR_PEP_ID=MMETSP0208-20121228/13199_1 /TAXON_ID=197538 /ORGANISM="Strombidium inclinatum, Strain S3" /LENGTH=126 /DNA_ID=CAMNT_0010768849 /DNA_START=201 /DNA_END=581 /DNA_ORIENTATION=-